MAWALSCAAWEGPFWRLAWALGLAGSSFFSTKSVKGWQNCWNTAGSSWPTVLMAWTPAHSTNPNQAVNYYYLNSCSQRCHGLFAESERPDMLAHRLLSHQADFATNMLLVLGWAASACHMHASQRCRLCQMGWIWLF